LVVEWIKLQVQGRGVGTPRPCRRGRRFRRVATMSPREATRSAISCRLILGRCWP